MRPRSPSLGRRLFLALLPLTLVSSAACGPREVNDEVGARLAYLGLDRAIDRAIGLGFDGYNAATSANIPEQSQPGSLGGLMVVGGQVDAGVSNNKEMRLNVSLSADYTDGPVDDREIFYNGGPADLTLTMKGLPNADLSGSFSGVFVLSGDLSGDVELDLVITGETEEVDGAILRRPGTIRVVGSATSAYGIFEVDVSL